MYIPIDDILEQINKDIFQSWEVVKCEIVTRDYNINIDPTFYEFNTLQYIKLGNLYYNRNCHLDTMNNYQFITELNINADLDTPYYYPIDLLNRYLNEQYISVDLKLRYPHNLKSVFDVDNHYNDFYVNFYHKYNVNNVYISCTEADNILRQDLNVEPMQKWYAYVYNLLKGGV